MSKPTIGIIGFGTVGRAVHHGFGLMADFRIYDVNENICENTFEETMEDSDHIYVCVPTPMNEDGGFDSSILDSVIDDCTKYTNGTNKVIIIKSTVLPGTTARYCEKYPNSSIVVSPEFLTERTANLDFTNPSRIIFGITMNAKLEGTVDSLMRVYRPKFPVSKIFVTDPTTAEMAKYVSNCFYATKLTYFNEIYQMCGKMKVNYNRLMKMVLAGGWVSNMHIDIPGHDGKFGFGGKCFPKDLNAFKELAKELGVEPLVMDAVWNKNKEVRNE